MTKKPSRECPRSGPSGLTKPVSDCKRQTATAKFPIVDNALRVQAD